MSQAKTSVQTMDKALTEAVKAMELSKTQIFEIAEGARKEYQSMKSELEKIAQDAINTIEEVDKLELGYRKARLRLVEVSRDFKRFTEEDIRVAYETANDVQIRLYLAREKESMLRNRRDELQLRLKNMERTISKAENLVTQVGVALDYLTGNLSQLGQMIESAQNRQMLGLRIIQAQEEERKRVAREIHDGPAQLMANVVLRAEIAERMLNKQDLNLVKQELVDLKDLVRNSLAEVRKIIFDLRPMALDDLGLVPTLRKYLTDLGERSGMNTELLIFGKEVRLPSTLEVAVFRLVQEALSNVVKHAHAKNTIVKIEFSPHKVSILVKDDGIGMEDVSVELQRQSRQQFGLIGMKERVELLEGTMNIYSSKAQGTKILLMIPMKEEV
jgi:two-component system sensor histidine kinase DegS